MYDIFCTSRHDIKAPQKDLPKKKISHNKTKNDSVQPYPTNLEHLPQLSIPLIQPTTPTPGGRLARRATSA